MAETDPISVHQDPTTELIGRFSETAGALFSAGGVIGTLQRAVDLAAETIEGCDLAGVFLLDGDSITTPVHTGPLVVEIDALQHQCEEPLSRRHGAADHALRRRSGRRRPLAVLRPTGDHPRCTQARWP